MTQDKLVSKIMESLQPVIRRLVDKETKTVNEWKEYKTEAMKCILVCSNCHKEIHSEIGYIFD